MLKQFLLFLVKATKMSLYQVTIIIIILSSPVLFAVGNFIVKKIVWLLGKKNKKGKKTVLWSKRK